MFLTRISVNHPVFATMVMIALMVFGVWSYQRLPVEQLPDMDLPIIAVVVAYPGASPEAVENDIIRPIEDVVNTLAGIDSIHSTAQAGQAMVLTSFDLELDSAIVTQDVRDRIAQIEAALPENAGKPQILRFDPGEMPVLSIAVSSEMRPARELTRLADDIIVRRLSIINGVGRATVVGGVPGQINILVDPDRMTAFNVAMGDVVAALEQDNRDLPAGAIRHGAVVQPVQVQGSLDEAEDFLDIIIARRGGQPVRLGDIATIEHGQADEQDLALINGERALAIDIVKVQGANTIEVADNVRAALAELLAGDLPPDIHVEIVRDTAIVVRQSVNAVQNMLIEGAALAVVIVFLFLNSWRSTVITGLALPISIIGTMTAIHFLGFTLNRMTLMALSLSIGILIDDAIVVRENIMRHLHMGKSHRQAALDGTNEIGLSVLATTLSIVAVFLPVAFMDGMMGRFFLQFGVTVSVAVMISLFVAFTVDPMLSSIWYDPAAEPDARRGPIGRMVARFDRGFEHLTGTYQTVLRWCLRHRLTVTGATLALFLGSFLLVPLVGAEFVPPEDNAEFQISLKTPVGSSLAYTTAKVRQAEDVLLGFPEITRSYATINSGQSSGEHSATILVSMLPESQRARTPQQMAAPVREALKSIPGIDVIVGVPAGGGGVSKPVQITIYGDSFDTLDGIAADLMGHLAALDGLADIESSTQDEQPLLGINLRREAASDLGVTMAQIAATLSPMLGGKQVGTWTDRHDDSFDVVVRLPDPLRQQPDNLGALPVAAGGAGGSAAMVRLDQVAEIAVSTGPGEIIREDLSRQVTVSANLSGATLGQVTTAIRSVIATLDVPAGYRIGMGGDSKRMDDAAGTAGSALLLAVIFIYLVLASQFGSFLQPLAIMVSLPLSLVGVIVGLLIGGTTLNLFSMIGFIMLMGLVVKNAILLVDNANQRQREGMDLAEALAVAGATRFRPIIMTSLAMIFGMLPLAFSLHDGSGANASMAHAVIGGLISSTLLTLVVVPVAVLWTDALGRRVGRFLPNAADRERIGASR